MKDYASQKVSFGEKFGYSLGDAAANLVFQMMMIFQLKFYTDVFGLDGAVAGSILMIGSLSAIIIDPTVGLLIDRTKTRWGKFRPWVLWTIIPFCLFYVLAFYNPGIQDKSMVATYATISYILMMTAYSFNNIPYATLGGVMTSDIKERTSITTIRFVAVTIAQFVVQGLTLPLVDTFGQENKQHGWVCTIALFACIAIVLFVITFMVSRERIQPPPSQESNIKEDIKDTVSDVSWNSMALLTFAIFITLAMWGSAMNFYFQYNIDQKSLQDFLNLFGLNVEQKEAYSIGFSLFNMSTAIVQFLGVVCLSRYLANKYGKKKVFIPLLYSLADGRQSVVRTEHPEVAGLCPDGSFAVGDDWRRGRPYRVSELPSCYGILLLRHHPRPEVRTGTGRCHRWCDYQYVRLCLRR